MKTPVALFTAACMARILFLPPAPLEAADPERTAAHSKAVGLAFVAEGKEYRFDTGLLRGSLRSQGRSLGLVPVFDNASGSPLAGPFGLLSHYRMLDADARYAAAAWDWPGVSQLLADGSVETRWSADKAHPFDMKAVYRWKAPHVLDLETSVTSARLLRRFEVFLASYFAGFPTSFAYVQACPETGGKPGFLEAKKSSGAWQTFPRDEEAVKTFADGRWKRPPNPVSWRIMPRLAAPLALRRDDKTGLTALLMAPPSDCFAVSMPYGEEGHRSVYLSLFGKDLAPGQTVTSRTRLVIGRGISDEQAINLYRAYFAPPPGSSQM